MYCIPSNSSSLLLSYYQHHHSSTTTLSPKAIATSGEGYKGDNACTALYTRTSSVKNSVCLNQESRPQRMQHPFLAYYQLGHWRLPNKVVELSSLQYR